MKKKVNIRLSPDEIDKIIKYHLRKNDEQLLNAGEWSFHRHGEFIEVWCTPKTKGIYSDGDPES